jgi:hypothetical protein
MLKRLNPKRGTSNKLRENWEGPYQIKAIQSVDNGLNYKLGLHEGDQRHNLFPPDRLKRYHGDAYNPLLPLPHDTPPDPDMDTNEYEVEKIIDKKRKKGKISYLVRWKGYSSENDTWEPLSNLKNAKDAIAAYESRQFKQIAPLPTSAFTQPKRMINALRHSS